MIHDDILAKRHTVSECRLVALKYSIPYVIQAFPKVSMNGEWLPKKTNKREHKTTRTY